MLLLLESSVTAASLTDMELVPEGELLPFFVKKDDQALGQNKTTFVEKFYLDTAPVTNRQFYEFISNNSEWNKQSIRKVFTDAHYLDHWNTGNGKPNSEDLDKPVVNVSWFGAYAYCDAQDKRLPTTDEWEYALSDKDRNKEGNQKKIMDWYSVPNHELPIVRSEEPNEYGIFDLIAVIWEWTADFNSYMAPPDSRNTGDKSLFCGSGSLNAKNLSDYAAFMRYSYRESLQGSFTGKNLGFRCAKDAK